MCVWRTYCQLQNNTAVVSDLWTSSYSVESGDHTNSDRLVKGAAGEKPFLGVKGHDSTTIAGKSIRSKTKCTKYYLFDTWSVNGLIKGPLER